MGSVVDTAIASYLPDKASIPAIANASMLFGLPSVLLAQALSHSLLPQITMQATHGRYLRMSLTILKIVGGAVLLCIPAALVLFLLANQLFTCSSNTGNSLLIPPLSPQWHCSGMPSVYPG